MRVINLFGGPGVGKSTILSETFALLKRKHCNCEKVEEFAKELVWDERYKTLENQIYIFGNQHHMLHRLKGKVDVVLTDGALFTSIIYTTVYKPSDKSTDAFKSLVYQEFIKYNNINVFIERETTYQKIGRYQDEKQAKDVDKQIIRCLEEFAVPYKRIGIENAARKIVDMI
jgi:nicotinamide riboside kinase